MDADTPQNPREELELRLTALLLGELDTAEAEAVRREIQGDPKLAELHDRLKETLDLVRAASADLPASSDSSEPMRLENRKRDDLLAHFKTLRPKAFKATRRPSRQIRLIEVAALLALVAILVAMLLPSLAKSKSKAQALSVRNNLKQIELAKQLWAEDEDQPANAVATMKDLEPYLGQMPESFRGEKYVPGSLSQPASVVADSQVFRGMEMSTEGEGKRVYRLFDQAVPPTLQLASKGVPMNAPSVPALQAEAPRANEQTRRGPGESGRGRNTVNIALPQPDEDEGADRRWYGKFESGGMGGAAAIGAVETRRTASGAVPDNMSLGYLSSSLSDSSARFAIGQQAGQEPGDTDGIQSFGQATIQSWDVARGAFTRPTTEVPLDVVNGTAVEGETVWGYEGNGVRQPAGSQTTSDGRLVTQIDANDFAAPMSAAEQAPARVMRRRELVSNERVAGYSAGSYAINSPRLMKEGLTETAEDSLRAGAGYQTRVEGEKKVPPTSPPAQQTEELFAYQQVDSPVLPAERDSMETLARADSTARHLALQDLEFNPTVIGRDLRAGVGTIDALATSAGDKIAQIQAEGTPVSGGTLPAEGRESSQLGMTFYAEDASGGRGRLQAGRQGIERFNGDTDTLARLSEQVRELPVAAEPPAPRKPPVEAPKPQPEVRTVDNPFSTFSLNVSDVSFKLAAASLEQGQMPEAAGIRSEEFLNAFDYHDPAPAPGQPLAFAWERARYPFAHNRDLVRFSVQTAASGRQAGRPLNLVLLLDNSGSMERADRVRIIRECLNVLSGQLTAQDRISVVSFARTPRLWIDGVSGAQAAASLNSLSGLTPEGGTNLEEAMRLAYATAERHYLETGVNRVVLLTDGAANLGDVDPESLKREVEQRRQEGIALDCFGIGWEGYNDDLLEVLSRHGDGRYGFVNTPQEARNEFADQLAGALQVAASDVKVQVEFNPGRVTTYRQIGYAKHQLKKEQFRDNTVDAAEIGSAESGNALYVIETDPNGSGPIGILRARFKVPATGEYKEFEWPVPYTGQVVALEEAGATLRLAASASAFSEWLAGSPYAGDVSTERLLQLMQGVPEAFGADSRPMKLREMLLEASRLAGN